MRFEFFIALRYLFSWREQTFISVVSSIAVASVALGLASVIIATGIMNGFTSELRDKIIGATAHGIIFSGAGNFHNTPEVMSAISSVPGVVSATPFIYSELLISSPSGGKGVILRGIDPKNAAQTLGALQKLEDNVTVDVLNDSDPLPGILLGKDLAKRLSVSAGGRVNLLAPTAQHTSAGYVPKIRSFIVKGIFSIGMFEYDSSLAFVSLNAAKDFLGWPEGDVSGVELAVDDIYSVEKIMQEVTAKIGSPYYGQTWITMNSNLFAALKLEKTAMGIVLFMIVVVGAFSIITALVMLVMQKTRDIAILMTMGATKSVIRRIFIIQGCIIGFMGTTLGYVLGVGISLLLRKYQFIELPKGVYPMDYLPVMLEWSDLLLAGAGSILICLLATLYPSRNAAALEPVSALRHE